MIVLGLTGSIGTGKSTTARFFAHEGCAVEDADAVVHRLYAGPLAGVIEAAFPGTTLAGEVDRAALGRRVLGDAAALERLEAIVHPAVRTEESAFLARARAERIRVAVLDVPLLLETRRPVRVDAVVVTTCAPDLQRRRVLARPGMTEARFAALLGRQMTDAEKRRHAHFIIDTGGGMAAAAGAVRDVLRAVSCMF